MEACSHTTVSPRIAGTCVAGKKGGAGLLSVGRWEGEGAGRGVGQCRWQVNNLAFEAKRLFAMSRREVCGEEGMGFRSLVTLSEKQPHLRIL
jgi:hypothetical protein